MSEAVKYCPDCGADNLRIVDKCFLCGRDLKGVKSTEIIDAELVEQRPANLATEWIFGIITLLLLGFLLLVGIGLAMEEPGVAIAFAIFVLPCVMVAGISSLKRHAQGEAFSFARTLYVFFMSAVMGIAAVSLLICATIMVLFAICMAAIVRN